MDKTARDIENAMEALWRSSHISGGNAVYVEALYEEYLLNPNSVPEEWKEFFDKLPRVEGVVTQDVPHSTIVEHFELLSKGRQRPLVAPGSGGVNIEHERKQVQVLALIASYRNRGHQKAKLDPLGIMEREDIPDLGLAYHQLSQADFDTVFQTGSFFIGVDEAPLSEIVAALEQTYCGSVGAEIMHIVDLPEKQWLQQRLESVRSAPVYTEGVKKYLLERLTAAEGLERHLDSIYPGTKRFGLEGGESLVPSINELIQRAGNYGAKEVVIGMAHRGRLNVLVNILGKKPSELFDEFEGKKLVNTSGDVKYHQGFSSNVMTGGGEVHLAMSFNPSHLEIVAPVAEGSVRARQDRRGDKEGKMVVPIIIHGDAAFAGQGVVMETFQMSQTRGFGTGGTVHIIINNQVGFTTNRQDDARSTEYCTDIAKMVQAPIFHVNGDDPEAVLFVTQLAMDYRYEFGKDVVIDLVCYRRRGHNETDEPSITQPMMYQKIRQHKTTRTLYADQLVKEGVMTDEETSEMADEYRELLDTGKHVARSLVSKPDTSLFVDWQPYLGHAWDVESDTSYPITELKQVAHKMCEIPDGIKVQRLVSKIYDDRNKMAAGALDLNWGMAETLAYATLLEQKFHVRLIGQDVGRGTFSHRHAVIHCQNEGTAYTPLQNLGEGYGQFDIHDSLLSEEAVLGFEFGYATTAPSTLVIWEAQFGDFANGAQVVIDQFVACGETKWGRLNGLTMLLPHGYEGQGPEHSSARLERFLQLCAEKNLQICIPTTPAQIYHLLRRQEVRPLRKPLVIMSPKWLLRHPKATSNIDELADGQFQHIIDEQHLETEDIQRVIMCSGKIYYHLLEEREAKGIDNVALIRIEQLYPFPKEELLKVLKQYKNMQDVFWCQEEPMNQGAWYGSQHHMRQILQKIDRKFYLEYLGRDASASPAAGYMSTHLEEQKAILDKAFDLG